MASTNVDMRFAMLIPKCAAGLALLATASAGVYAVAVSGSAPANCRVDGEINVTESENGTAGTGAVAESCNAPGGYDVGMDTSPGSVPALASVDGTTIPLSSDGHTRIVGSGTAAKRNQHLRLQTGVDRVDQASLRIVAR